MLAYLNNATTSFPKTASALSAFVSSCEVIPLDVRHTAKEGASVPRLKERCAQLLGVESSEIFFPADATLGINFVIQGILAEGGYCVTDNRPHNAVLRTLSNLKSVKFDIMELHNVDDSINLDTLQSYNIQNASLCCLTHASNVNGSIYDMDAVIGEIRTMAPDTPILIDASQSAGVVDIKPVIGLADFIVFPGHKYLHSVPGASVLIAKRPLKPFVFGGTGSNSSEAIQLSGGEHVVEVGTPNIPAIEALVAALEEADRNLDKYNSVIASHMTDIWERLSGVSQINLIGKMSAADKTAIIAFSSDRFSPEGAWVPFLAAQGVIVRGGLHCAPIQHKQLGLERSGTVRLSVSRFTEKREIDLSVDAIHEFLRFAGGQ